MCGKEFKVDNYMLKKGNGKYCSYKCSDLSRRKRIERICPVCGRKYWAYPSRLKVGKGKYCSRECYWKALDTRV